MEWDYYDAMVAQDEKELQERIVDAIEYLALFINPEGVKKISSLRKEKKNDLKIQSSDDAQFANLMAKIAGEEKLPVFKRT